MAGLAGLDWIGSESALIDWCCKTQGEQASNWPKSRQEWRGEGRWRRRRRRKVWIGRKWAGLVGNSVEGGRARALSVRLGADWASLRTTCRLERGRGQKVETQDCKMIRGRAGAAFFIRGCEWPKSARCGSLPAPEQVQVPGPGPDPSKFQFQGKEGRSEGQEGAGGPSSAGKFSTSWWWVRIAGELGGSLDRLGTPLPVGSLAFRQVPRPSSNLRPPELGTGQGTV